ELMSGALLRVYQAGTSTPVTAYKDVGLTAGQEHTWPIVADGAGRVPMFWLPAGSYRVRLTAADGGSVAYAIPSIATIGAANDDGGGGGAGVSQEVLHQTGDAKVRFGSGTHAGWVRANGRSIGSASSGATERANADTQALYEYLWGEFSDSICPVTGGRGASAAADFAANKPLQLPDARGCALFCADDMGTTAAGRITSATFPTPTAVATRGGAETVTLTEAQIPVLAHDITDPGHAHTPTYTNVQGLTPGAGTADFVGTGVNTVVAAINLTINSAQTGISIADHGGGEAHPNVPPGIIVTLYIKL